MMKAVLVPRAGFESAIWPTLLVGVVNPVFSYTLGFPSRVLSQAELSREQIPTSAFLGTRQRQFSLDNLSLLLVQESHRELTLSSFSQNAYSSFRRANPRQLGTAGTMGFFV